MAKATKGNRLQRMETSKKILAGSWTAAITLTVIVTIGTFKQVDVTNITILASASWAELTAAHGFYYWKSKNENRHKGAQKLIRELAQEHGIDAAARFAEIIYKD